MSALRVGHGARVVIRVGLGVRTRPIHPQREEQRKDKLSATVGLQATRQP